jgi:hypothetical protein
VEDAGEVICGVAGVVAGFVRGFARFAEIWMVGSWVFDDSLVGGDAITVGVEPGGLSVGVGDCAGAFSGIPAAKGLSINK